MHAVERVGHPVKVPESSVERGLVPQRFVHPDPIHDAWFVGEIKRPLFRSKLLKVNVLATKQVADGRSGLRTWAYSFRALLDITRLHATRQQKQA